MDKAKTAVVFRDSFKGYNKADVAEYIETLNRDYMLLESQYKSAIASQKEQLAERDAQIEKLMNERTASQEETEKDNIILGLNNMIAELKTENDQLKQKAGQYTAELEELRRSACESDDDNDNKEILEKARLYDRMSGQLGDILLTANERAGSEVERIKGSAVDAVSSVINEMKESLRKLSGDCIADMEHKCSEAIEELNEQAKQIYSKLADSLDCIKTDEKI